jgi:hypothetical protein
VGIFKGFAHWKRVPVDLDRRLPSENLHAGKKEKGEKAVSSLMGLYPLPSLPSP